VAEAAGEPIEFDPDPDHPGWLIRRSSDTGRFIDIFGDVRARIESKRIARLRLEPGPQHRNRGGFVHGGFILAAVDQALFVGPRLLGVDRVMGAVTVDASTQFYGPVMIGKPFDMVVETLRVTRRMVFIRGLIEQDGIDTAAFSGTIRRSSE
jgi:acyl-coenzyme A thioesterase PaaI-like protein